MARSFITILSVFFVAGIAASCAVKTDVQHSRTDVEPTDPVLTGTSVANGAVERPRDEAIVEHLDTDYRVSGRSFDDIKDLAAPELIFVFGAERKSLKGLSSNASEIVTEHWRKALKRFYDTEFHPPRSAKEQVERDHAWGDICSKTQQRLMETPIDSPGGRRKISYTESSGTVGLLNRLALDLVREARATEERLPTTQL